MNKLTQPKNSKKRLPQIREKASVLAALSSHAHEPGISANEALRQIMTHYADQPWPLSPFQGREMDLDGRTAGLIVDQRVHQVITTQAQAAGVSVGDAMRQILRHWLAN